MSLEQLLTEGFFWVTILGLIGYLHRDNKADHKEIFNKLHSDHESIGKTLMDLYEKVGGKEDK